MEESNSNISEPIEQEMDKSESGVVQSNQESGEVIEENLNKQETQKAKINDVTNVAMLNQSSIIEGQSALEPIINSQSIIEEEDFYNDDLMGTNNSKLKKTLEHSRSIIEQKLQANKDKEMAENLSLQEQTYEKLNTRGDQHKAKNNAPKTLSDASKSQQQQLSPSGSHNIVEAQSQSQLLIDDKSPSKITKRHIDEGKSGDSDSRIRSFNANIQKGSEIIELNPTFGEGPNDNIEERVNLPEPSLEDHKEHDNQQEPPSSSNNRRANNKTPTVILQDDIYSYEILYGNKIDNQINMVNIIDPASSGSLKKEKQSPRVKTTTKTEAERSKKSVISQRSPSYKHKNTLKQISKQNILNNNEAQSVKPMQRKLRNREMIIQKDQQTEDVYSEAYTEQSQVLTIDKLQDLNTTLRSELNQVVQQMEFQVQKIQDKRRLKKADEARKLSLLESRKNKLKSKQKRFQELKSEVNDMWTQLEQEFKIDEITKMEDELRVKQKSIIEHKAEANTKNEIATQKLLRLEQMNKQEENEEQVRILGEMIAKANLHYKRLRNETIEDARTVKQLHEEVLRLDELCKRKANIIMTEKQKKGKCEQRGEEYTQKCDANKSTKGQNQEIIKEIIQIKQELKDKEKKFKLECQNVEKRMEEVKNENKIIDLKNKEKEQEVKLSDLKIKEMKKTIPNNRLRPLQGKRNTLDPENMLPMVFSPLKISQQTNLLGEFDPIFQKDAMKIDEELVQKFQKKKDNMNKYNNFIRYHPHGSRSASKVRKMIQSQRNSVEPSKKHSISPKYRTPQNEPLKMKKKRVEQKDLVLTMNRKNWYSDLQSNDFQMVEFSQKLTSKVHEIVATCDWTDLKESQMEVKCKKNHSMETVVAGEMRLCGECYEAIDAQQQHHQCQPCEFNLCSKCAMKQNSDKPPIKSQGRIFLFLTRNGQTIVQQELCQSSALDNHQHQVSRVISGSDKRILKLAQVGDVFQIQAIVGDGNATGTQYKLQINDITVLAYHKSYVPESYSMLENRMGPQLAERTARSRQRERMGIKESKSPYGSIRGHKNSSALVKSKAAEVKRYGQTENPSLQDPLELINNFQKQDVNMAIMTPKNQNKINQQAKQGIFSPKMGSGLNSQNPNTYFQEAIDENNEASSKGDKQSKPQNPIDQDASKLLIHQKQQSSDQDKQQIPGTEEFDLKSKPSFKSKVSMKTKDDNHSPYLMPKDTFKSQKTEGYDNKQYKLPSQTGTEDVAIGHQVSSSQMDQTDLISPNPQVINYDASKIHISQSSGKGQSEMGYTPVIKKQVTDISQKYAVQGNHVKNIPIEEPSEEELSHEDPGAQNDDNVVLWSYMGLEMDRQLFRNFYNDYDKEIDIPTAQQYMETYNQILDRHCEKPLNVKAAYEAAYAKMGRDETAKDSFLDKQQALFYERDINDNNVLEQDEYHALLDKQEEWEQDNFGSCKTYTEEEAQDIYDFINVLKNEALVNGIRLDDIKIRTEIDVWVFSALAEQEIRKKTESKASKNQFALPIDAATEDMNFVKDKNAQNEYNETLGEQPMNQISLERLDSPIKDEYNDKDEEDDQE